MKPSILTGLPRVNHEAGVVEGGSLGEAVALNFDLAGVADLRLDNHDGDGTVGDVTAVLQDADLVFAHLPGDEGDTWEEERGGRRIEEMREVGKHGGEEGQETEGGRMKGEGDEEDKRKERKEREETKANIWRRKEEEGKGERKKKKRKEGDRGRGVNRE